MTDRDVIQLFEQHHPTTQKDAETLGLNLVRFAHGCSRTVYKLTPTLVAKFVCGTTLQSENEIEALEQIHNQPRFEEIRKYVPPLYYGNKKTGAILTKFYSIEVTYEEQKELEPVIRKLEDYGINDLFCMNFRRDENGNLIAIDLGHAHL